MRHWDDYYSGGNHRLLVGICNLIGLIVVYLCVKFGYFVS